MKPSARTPPRPPRLVAGKGRGVSSSRRRRLGLARVEAGEHAARVLLADAYRAGRWGIVGRARSILDLCARLRTELGG